MTTNAPSGDTNDTPEVRSSQLTAEFVPLGDPEAFAHRSAAPGEAPSREVFGPAQLNPPAWRDIADRVIATGSTPRVSRRRRIWNRVVNVVRRRAR